jgi:ketol-acid reductoisomerase
MATNYIVQCFQLRGRKLVADQPKTARNSDAAVELAERLGSLKAGAVAFSQEIDVETDTYDEPRVLYRVGTLAPGLFAED